MKYDGFELTEIFPENWDGNTREMLVWDDTSKNPFKKIVVGYVLRGNRWMSIDGNYWQYCAEIPTVAEEDVMRLLNDNEKEILELKAENEELKEKIKSLQFERSEIARDVAWAVDKELIEKSVLDHPHSGHRITVIHELVEKKILEYTEYKPKKKLRRMTNRELKEWCAEGKGLFKNDYTNTAYTVFGYNVNSDEMNAPVGNWIHIRAWNEDAWHEPLIEE